MLKPLDEDGKLMFYQIAMTEKILTSICKQFQIIYIWETSNR